MPINPNAAIEITAFRWVPEFAQGVVRDPRARWALEDAGLDYKVQLLGQERPAGYICEQPFDQVPILREGDVQIFESGAIVQYIGEKSETLLPKDSRERFRAIQWTYAALNSVEPAIMNLLLIDIFFTGQEWAKLRRPGAEDFVKLKLKRLSDWLGDKQWLEGDRFTIGDLMMVTTLRFLTPSSSPRPRTSATILSVRKRVPHSSRRWPTSCRPLPPTNPNPNRKEQQHDLFRRIHRART